MQIRQVNLTTGSVTLELSVIREKVEATQFL
jgi:hypothetical protein